MHHLPEAVSHAEELSPVEQAVGALDQPVTVHDLTGAVTACNSAALELFGLAPRRMLGSGARRPAVEVVFEDTGGGLSVESSPVHRVLADGRPLRGGRARLRPHGDSRWRHVRWSAQPIRDGGRVTGVVMSYVELVGGHPPELADAVRSMVCALVDEARVLLLVKDLEGRYLLVNQGAAAMIGRTPAELHGLTEADVLPVELTAHYAATDRDVLRRRSVLLSDDRWCDNGEIRELLTLKVPLIGADGEPYAIAVLGCDVPDRTLPTPQQRHLQLMQRIAREGLAMVEFDDNGAVVAANPAARELLGDAPVADALRALAFQDAAGRATTLRRAVRHAREQRGRITGAGPAGRFELVLHPAPVGVVATVRHADPPRRAPGTTSDDAEVTRLVLAALAEQDPAALAELVAAVRAHPGTGADAAVKHLLELWAGEEPPEDDDLTPTPLLDVTETGELDVELADTGRERLREY